MVTVVGSSYFISQSLWIPINLTISFVCLSLIVALLQSRRKLNRKDREARMILDSLPAMIWFKDRNNRILWCNRRAAESIGHTAQEIEGHFTQEFTQVKLKNT